MAASAHIYGDAKIFGGAIMDQAIISGHVKIYDSVQVRDSARLCDYVRASGAACFRGNVRVFGSAQFQGQADVASADDWCSVSYRGEVITLYKSRAAAGYEVNVDGYEASIDSIEVKMGKAIAGFLAEVVKDRRWSAS